MTVFTILVVCVSVALAVLAGRPRRHWFIIPAAAIVLIAAVVAMIAPGAGNPPWATVLIAVGFGALGVIGGNPAVGLVLRFAQGTVELGAHGGIYVSPDGSMAPRREILRGGATIGYLERIALVGSLAAGQAAAVAVIVAIKGLGRFSELDDSEARERFIIGTLTSLIWAAACWGAILLLG